MTIRRGYALAFSLGATLIAGAVGVGGVGCSSSPSSAGPGSPDDGGGDVVTGVPDGGASDGAAQGSPDAAQSAPGMIGVSGGTVSAPGVLLTIPPGALAGDTAIAITTSTTQVPAGYTALSPVFGLEPAGTTLLAPATIDITLTTPTSVGATVFLSNGAGGFDALATTSTVSSASASVGRLGDCFAGLPPADSGVDGGSTGDAGEVTDSGGDTGTGANDGSSGDAASDAGVLGIVATIDAVSTTFAANASVTDLNGVWRIQADDNATSTHWTLQLLAQAVQQQVCSTSSAYPAVNYTHYTGGVADSVFSTLQTQGYCTVTAFAPAAQGDYAHGSFSGGVDRAVDAGGGDHLIESATYDVLY